MISQHFKGGKRVGQPPKTLACDNVGCLARELYIEAKREGMGEVAVHAGQEVCMRLFDLRVASGVGGLLGWLCDTDIYHALSALCKYPDCQRNVLWDAQ